MQFQQLQLIDPILRAIAEDGYSTPSPIQEKAIPPALAGSDVLGCAQTGTGKTAAFALPILQRLHENKLRRPAEQTSTGHAFAEGKIRSPRAIRALVLTPTRELATQVGDSFNAYGRHLDLRASVVFGGVGQGPQVQALRAGIDILVACPGRLLDLMSQRYLDFRRLEVLVLDEADRMLDMGFIHDVRKVLAAVPRERQTLFFSATMPPAIQELADSILKSPVKVEVAPRSSATELVEHFVYFVEKANKPELLKRIFSDGGMKRTLVFTRTKHGADRLAQRLTRSGIRASAMHADKGQGARERALSEFKSGVTPVLVATDIAARGIDVDDVTHVVNYDLPNVPETFVHRIGRTGRAGARGVALSFCDFEEREYLEDIEKLIRKSLAVVPHDLQSTVDSMPKPAPKKQGAKPARRNFGRRDDSFATSSESSQRRRRRPRARNRAA